MDRDFCRVLTERLGLDDSLVVVELVNATLLRQTTSIPTAALAAKRFESAVLAATPAWLSGGLLSYGHVGLLFASIPTDLSDAIGASVKRYRFVDPWAGAGEIQLVTIMAVVELRRLTSMSEVMQEVGRALDQARATLPEDWPPASNPVDWCK
jgi:hypothetical protein